MFPSFHIYGKEQASYSFVMNEASTVIKNSVYACLCLLLRNNHNFLSLQIWSVYKPVNMLDPSFSKKKKSLIDKGFSRTFSFLQEQKWVKLA
jgi:hypothetical protein